MNANIHLNDENPADGRSASNGELAIDPYIEAQKRLDACITTRNYESALPLEIAKRCIAAMKLPSIIEMRKQSRDLHELGKLQKRIALLENEIARLTAN